MEGWVDLGYLAMHRPGVEPAIYRSQVQRPNHYSTEQPIPISWCNHQLSQLRAHATHFVVGGSVQYQLRVNCIAGTVRSFVSASEMAWSLRKSLSLAPLRPLSFIPLFTFHPPGTQRRHLPSEMSPYILAGRRLCACGLLTLFRCGQNTGPS